MRLRRVFDIRRWLASRRRMLEEIDEEFRFHVEQRTLDNEAAGMSPAEARRDAERRFGDFGRYRRQGEKVLRGHARSEARESFLAEHLGDFRFGWRMLAKTPVLSAAAILTIGLGIAGTTTVASQAYGLVLRGLPFEDGDRLMRRSGRPRAVLPATCASTTTSPGGMARRRSTAWGPSSSRRSISRTTRRARASSRPRA